MKKMMTKVLSVVFCISFLSLQMSFADVLQSGMFANKDVLTGAQIKGHTNGLIKIDTNATLNEATLHFNNNTRIDWNKFNVYKDQTLTFKNGSYGVLNNVVGTSISKFAGTIKADSGKIIISNPNGILFEGGKFESMGGLVLTTKDLTAIAIDDSTDFDNLDISSAAYGDSVAIVAITNSSNINAADINIVSKGIYVDSSTLTASDANGIVLTTTDGSTFVASHTMTAEDGSVKNIKFTSKARPTQIANSAFTSKNGEIKFVSDKGAYIDGSTFDGNVNVKNNALLMTNSNIDGNLDVVAKTYVQLDTVKAGDTNIASNYFTRLYDVTLGKTTIKDTSDNYMVIGGHSTFDGNLDIIAKCIIFGWYTKDAVLQDGSITVNGDLTVNALTDIGYSNVVRANNINFTTENGSILQANSDAMSGKLIANNINLTANNGFVVSLNANVANNTSDYVDILACRKSFATDKFNKGTVDLEGGSATINTKVALVKANLTGDLNANANNIQVVGSKVGGKADLKASKGIYVANSTVGGTLDANSNGYVQMDTVKAGDTTINSNQYTKLFDVDLGNTTITDTSDNYIVIAGNSTINGDLTATAMGSSDVDDANVIFGWYDKNANLQDGSLTVTGKLTANASGNIGYSNTVSADKIEMKSTKGSIFQAKSDNINGKLISDDVSLSAPNGYIAALDGNVENNSSEYFRAMQNTVSRDNFESAVGKNILDADAIDIKSATDNGDLKITIDTSVINISADAGNTDLKVTPDTVENVVISSTGNLKTGDITIKKSNDDTTGNGSFTSRDGSVTIDNVKADTDLIISAAKDVKGTDLVADAEGNGVGDLIINAGGKADIDGASGKNVGISSVADSIVKNVTGADDVIIESKEGTVTGSNLIADGDQDGIGDLIIKGKGDVTIDGASGENVSIDSKDGNADIKHVTGADDVIINAINGTVTGNDLTADGDQDGIGDLIINGKGDVKIDDASGENVSIVSKDGDADVKHIEGTNDVIIDASNGSVTGSDLIADADKDGKGDLIIKSGDKTDIDGGSGKNVDIVSGGDASIKNVTGDDDVKIKSDGNVTGGNLKADNDNDKKGDLIIDAKGDVDIDGGSGNNVDIDSGNNTTVKDIIAKDDITIDAGGDVKGDHLTADGDKDGIGDIIINGGGKVDIDDAHGNTITINGKPGGISDSSADNGIFWNGVQVDGNNSLTEEVLKNLNNLQQSGVNTAMVQSFTPIAFAASDDDEEQSALAKRIAKTVFKTPDGVVTITDRFDTIK